MDDLPQAIVAWEASHRNWVDAGGDGPDDHKTVGALLSLLPWDVKERALWDYELYKDNPMRLKRWVKDKVKLLNSWKVARRGNQGAHALEVPTNDQDGHMEGLLALTEDADDEEICAVFRRAFQKRNGAAAGPGAARPCQAAGAQHEAPLRDLRDAQCPNCGVKGHLARDCPKPQLPRDQRACWTCGQTGHTKDKCPNGARPPAVPLKCIEGPTASGGPRPAVVGGRIELNSVMEAGAFARPSCSASSSPGARCPHRRHACGQRVLSPCRRGGSRARRRQRAPRPSRVPEGPTVP